MPATNIKRKIAASEWFETAKQNEIITYQELADLIPPEWIDPKNCNLILDCLEENGISVITSRQKIHRHQPDQKKLKKDKSQTIPLPQYDKNDPLTLFLRAYNNLNELSDSEKQAIIREIRQDEQKLESLLFQSLYPLYVLMIANPPESIDRDTLPALLINFDANAFKALLLHDKQIHYYRNWFDTIWGKWKSAVTALNQRQADQADQLIGDIVDSIIQLKWKKDVSRKLLTSFIHEEDFARLSSAKEDEYVCLRARLTEYRRLCQEIAERFQRKKDELIKSHMKLVLSMAKSYTGKGIDFMDLIQEGNKGLIDAIDRYELRFELPFSKYVTRHIRKTIRDYVASNFNSLEVSNQKMELAKKIRKTQDRLTQELQREPSIEEISIRASLPVGVVNDLMQLLKRETSWDGMVNLNRTEFRRIQPLDSNQIDQNKINRRLSDLKLSASLTDREEQILKLKYGFNGLKYNDEEISRIFDLDMELVLLIERNAYQKLKKEIKLLEIKGFVVFP